MTPHPYAVLACDVFLEELEELGGHPPPWRALRTLEMGLHDVPDRLREAVGAAIAELERDPEPRTLALAYGRCGNGLVGVRAGRCALVLPQAHDCISILLGGRRPHDAQLARHPGTYFFSPGWTRGKRVPGPDREAWVREQYADRYPDDEEMLDELVEADREAYEHHDRAAYVSIVDRPGAAAYCETCARHLGWSHQTLAGDRRMLGDLIAGRWDREDFLIVPPGHAIDADADGRLIAVP